MSEKTESYFPISIRTFRMTSKDVRFDVYLKLAEHNYAHVFSRATGIDYKRLAQYLKKGVTHLYIKTEDEPLFKEYLQQLPEQSLLDPKVNDSKKVGVLLNMAEQSICEFAAAAELPDEVIESSSKAVKGIVKMMSSNPKSMQILLKAASHGDYLYYHSIAVSVTSIVIARALALNDKTVELVGVGGFLHDVGTTLLPKEMNDSLTELTPAQWREMRTHPKLGMQALEGCKNIPDEVLYIILQHHEEHAGSGYPAGLRGNVIFYPAKIVSIADCFCALITKRPYREAFSIEQALAILMHESGQKHDPDLVSKFVSIMSPKKVAAA